MSQRWIVVVFLAVGCGRTDFAAVECPDDATDGVCAAADAITEKPVEDESGCGVQLGQRAVTFCDTFDAPAGIGDRAGALDGTSWRVARNGPVNVGQGQYNIWNRTNLEGCSGTVQVLPPNDIVICNGQLREASNDNNSGVFGAGGTTALSMTAKQPFDFDGRTGTIGFDVSNDSLGTHAAWPELWVTNLPVPTPFHHFDSWQALPEHGVGLRLSAAALVGDRGSCPTFDDLDKRRWTVDSVSVVRDYLLDAGGAQLTQRGCVIASSGPGDMNHVEVRVSRTSIQVWATDAGVAPTVDSMKLLAEVTNADLGFTRGFITLEDAHFNADEGPSPSQREHTFAWDNVAFDGPSVTAHPMFSAPDDTVAAVNNAVILGKLANAGATTSWSIANVPASPSATAARVLFNFLGEGTMVPSTLGVVVNGNVHTVPWPYPDTRLFTWRTAAITIAIADLVAGVNTVEIGADQALVYSNVDIELVP